MFNKADITDRYSPTKGERALQHQLRVIDALRAKRDPDTPSLSSDRELVSPTGEQTSPGGTLPTADGN